MPSEEQAKAQAAAGNEEKAESDVTRALGILARELHEPRLLSYDTWQLRKVLADTLIENVRPLSKEFLEAMDEVYANETSPAVAADATLPGLWLMPPGGRGKVVVWRGDITKLAVDAVVNAANEQGLGCFVARHRCIDNVLHRAAGPRLREECRQCMAKRQSPLSAGTKPIVTSAYHLPCKMVLHVTGPCMEQGSMPSAEHEEQLASCYSECLEAASSRGLRSIAFCCISTGLFGYPADLAAQAALRSVRRWLEHPDNQASSIELVVFDVFTDKDEQVYREFGPKVLKKLDGA